MEKKEMRFAEKVDVAGGELKKAIKDGYAVILIASEVQDAKSGRAEDAIRTPTRVEHSLAPGCMDTQRAETDSACAVFRNAAKHDSRAKGARDAAA